MATEQDLLAARLEDSIKLSRKRPCFLGFLDEAQAAFCQERLSRRQDVAYLSCSPASIQIPESGSERSMRAKCRWGTAVPSVFSLALFPVFPR